MAEFDYGYHADNIDALSKAIDSMYDEVDTYIKDNMGNVKSSIADVWTGDDEKAFEDAFDNDIKNLTKQVKELIDIVSDNMIAVKKTWQQTQSNNKNTVSNLGRYE